MAISDVPLPVRQLVTELADAKPMRRGSLSERTIKGRKPSCACAQDPKARHGPYSSLTHAVGGKTRSRFVTAEQADMVLQPIAAGRKLRGRARAFWEACSDAAVSPLSRVPAYS